MSSQYSIKVIERALRILDLGLEMGTSFSAAEVGRELDINPNMAYRLLKSLCAGGYLEQNDVDTRFHPTLKILRLGNVVLEGLDVRTQALPYMSTLWSLFPAASVNLAVLWDGVAIGVERFQSNRLSRTGSYVGRKLALHATSLGKVLISELDSSELTRVVGEEPFQKFTDATICSVDALELELERTRNRGLAVDTSEYVTGLHCLSAPVRDHTRQIIAAVGLSALEIHLSPEQLEEAKMPLREAATSISCAMGFPIG